jgi:hypothetical protein
MVTGISVRVPRLIHRAPQRATVVAVDASGGGTGATIGAVAPVEVPTVTLTVSETEVRPGAVLILSGRATGAGGRALAGVHVLLRYRQTRASTSWVGVPLTTTAEGNWSFRMTASHTCAYVATISGVPGVRAGATSPEVAVTVV